MSVSIFACMCTFCMCVCGSGDHVKGISVSGLPSRKFEKCLINSKNILGKWPILCKFSNSAFKNISVLCAKSRCNLIFSLWILVFKYLGNAA